MSLITPVFQSLAVQRGELAATPALTPALSPRRGRILRRVLSQCQPSVLRQSSPANHPPAATINSTSESSQRARSLSPLPGGEGQGEGERHTYLVSSNQPARDQVRGMIVRGMRPKPEKFSFPIPLTIIPLTSPLRFQVPVRRNARLHPHHFCTIVPHGSTRRHRGRRMGRVVCHDAARTLARQRRVVGALSGHRRFA
jgi:hypothetical protein